MAKLVSATYGEALFELAVEEGKEEEFLNEIIQLRTLLSENPDFEPIRVNTDADGFRIEGLVVGLLRTWQ